MLQRAASNAYSWWWASHIRTKQSKWMEQNLQDMEEKVQTVLKLIEEDGDSFAKRAEMYYKKRPELIHFVEESYRAYRALAERYDHISTELQNANNTIAYVFPEQVQFAMEEDEDEATPKFPKKPPEIFKANIPNVPKIPKDLKGKSKSATKKLESKRSMKAAASTTTVAKSGLSKSEGIKEIDKIQKQILALQTEKEFVKSSYEGGLAKYWEIEQQIREMQEKVCSLQDEFGAGTVIEDDEARTLMASAALKSCQETLAQLYEKQERSAEEASVECKRIHDAQEKLKTLKDEFLHDQINQEMQQAMYKSTEELKSLDKQVTSSAQERQDLELLRKKIKEQFEIGSTAPVTVTELVEKIDELVNKVISLEAAVSSQTALIQRLRTETDELQAQIQTLEDDKAPLISGKNDLSSKLLQMEEKLHGVQDLNQSVENQKNNLQTHFTEARCNLDHLSEKLHNVKPDEELQVISQTKEGSLAEVESQEEFKGHEGLLNPNDSHEELQNVKPEDELNVSSISHEEFNIREGAMNPNDSLEERQNVKPEEKLNVSSGLHEEFNPRAGPLNPDNGLEKPQNPQKVNPNDSLEEQQNVKPEEELNVSSELHEEFNPQACPLSPDNGIEEPQNVKRDKELKVSDPRQKEGKSPAEIGSLTDLKEQDEKLNHCDVSEKATDNKKEEEEIKEHDLSVLDRNHTENASQSHTDTDGDNLSETYHSLKIEEKTDKRASPKSADKLPVVETQEEPTKQDDEPDWKRLFMNGIENREKILLTEYTAVLRNFKEIKKKLTEAEQKSGDSLFDTTVQLRELKSANAKKDEQIRFLRQKLSLLQAGLGEDNKSEKSTITELQTTEKEVTEHINVILMEQAETTSEIEKRFRMNIDEVLEENLDFWLRFSTTFQEIQKFETEVQDLQSEMLKLDAKQKKQDGSSTAKYSLKSDAKPLYKHLREIHTELTVWLEKSMLLKDEVKSRFSSLCDIQEEITAALKESAEDEDFKFTSYQAAKFQGEILNMKQENNKVADELQAGLDHITTLQLEVEKTLAKLNEEFKLSGSKNQQNIQLQHSESRSRVPLRSFIFGIKPKKQRHSIFSCMHPTLHRKYNGLRSGPSM